MLGEFYLLTVLYSIVIFALLYIHKNKKSFKKRISLINKNWGENEDKNYVALVFAVLVPVLNAFVFTLLLYLFTCKEETLENFMKNVN